MNVKEANAVPIDLGNDGPIGACVAVGVAAAEAANAGEAAAVADGNSGAFAIDTSIGSDDTDAVVVGEGDGDGKGEMVTASVVNFPLGLTGVSMVGGLLGAVALLAGVRPICQ